MSLSIKITVKDLIAMMEPKTSQTHPLRIDFAQPKSASGRIGMTLCPGKKQANGLSGSWERSLEQDIQVISCSGIHTVVTLMEWHELEFLKVSDIAEKCQLVGLGWYHLPIVDGDIPDKLFEKEWKSVGQALKALLLDGQDILLHCMGGLGRTGTIASRLLMELDGVGAGEAIGLVRKARPGAVETNRQERYLAGGFD